MNDVNGLRPPSAERVPTLTEVVELVLLEPDLLVAREVPLSFDQPTRTAAEAALWLVPPVAAPAAEAPDVDTLVAQVLAQLTPRIDTLFEARLREALAPALARAADGLIRDTAVELSATLRALVEETVAQALRRQDPA